MAILEVQHIEKSFGATQVLQDISFGLERGQALAIIGSSGSGKTTLLRCLNFLETPDRGSITVDGHRLFDAADPATQRESEIRKKRLHFGLVFQSFNLFPQYTALQNVTLAKELLAQEAPGYKAGRKRIHAGIEAEGRELLEQMGLSDRAAHYPHQLSGGQQQRVAIARALALHPDIHRHPRDGLRPGCGRSGHLHGWRRHRGGGPRPGDHRAPPAGAHPAVSGPVRRQRSIAKTRPPGVFPAGASAFPLRPP